MGRHNGMDGAYGPVLVVDEDGGMDRAYGPGLAVGEDVLTVT